MAPSAPQDPVRFSRRSLPLVAGIIAAATASACSARPSESPAPGQTSAPGAGGRTLVIGATAEPPTLDPTASPAAAIPQALLYNVYETLLRVDAEGALRPLLAQRWDLTPDRLTYTFTLNPAAHFSDGSPVTAEAVAQNIDRIRTDPGIASRLKGVMAVVEEVTAVDAGTLQVRLARPSNLWLYEMSSTPGVVINPAGFGGAASATAGSGPFTVTRWTPGDAIVMARNENYWGTPANFDEVTIRYILDANALNAAMLSGQIDVIANLQAPDALPQFADPARFTVVEGTTNGEVVLGVNNANPVLADPRVRKALTMAIEKRALVDTVWAGKGTVIGTMSVPTDPYYEDLSGLHAYDPDAARALLAEAGHPALTLRLRPAALPYATRAAQFVASQLAAVGVTAQVEEVQFPARWIETVYGNADYDLTIVSHVEARDLITFANPDYYWRYANPEFDALVRAADEADPADYVDGMRAAARFLGEDAAAIWLFVLPNLVITRAGITGVPPNATTLSFDVTTMASA
ncbi:ABC transporter substrate-binding protein [Propioniciclava soli]|uniref:ABC transporter substrate-binding protein n=1 Tax=Propioniciclava soli TaxID=2775081 RepID=A0ABZ3C3J4_9ACTN